MSYRPQIKNNTNGAVTDLALDAETVKGVDVAHLFYSSDKTYSANDVCIYNGKLYVSAVDSNTGHTPSSSADTSYWVRMFV